MTVCARADSPIFPCEEFREKAPNYFKNSPGEEKTRL